MSRRVMEHLESLPARSRQGVVALGAVALLGGAVSFLGYILDVARLADRDGNGIAIQPNASLCAALSGLAVVLLGTGRRTACGVCGAVVLLIGGLTLIQWITGFSFGIDRLFLFDRQWGRVGVVYPGRMGPPGSVCWSLIGTALVLSAFQGRARAFAPGLALLSMAISGVSLLGYLYRADPLFAHPTATVIALQTAMFVMALSLAIMACHADREPIRMLFDSGSAGALARRIVPLMLVATVGLGYLHVKLMSIRQIDTSTGTALFVLGLLVVLAVPLWWMLAALRERDQKMNSQAELLNTVNNSTSDLIFMKDMQGRLIYANAATLKVVGRHSLNVPTLDSDLLPVASEHAAIAENDRIVRETGRTICVEEVCTTADGVRHVYLSSKSPLRDASGAIVGVIGVSQDITERKQSEQALLQSERRIRQIIEQLPTGVGVMDLSGKWVLENPLMDQYVPVAMPSVLTERMDRWRAWDEQGNPVAPENWPGRRALRGETVAPGLEMLYRSDEGEELWMRVSAAPLRDDAGEIIGATAVVHNIDAVKRADQKIRRSEAIHRRLAEANLFGVGFGDSKGNVFYVHDEMLRMMGRTRQEFDAGTINWAECIAPEHRESIAVEAQRVLSEGQSSGYEAAFLRPDGGRTLYLAAAALVEPGEDFHVSIALDVTDIRTAEQSLRASEERLRLIIESAREYAIFSVDPSGLVTGWNSGAQNLLGYEEAEVLGRSAHLFYTPEDSAQAVPDRELELARAKGRAENERWHVRKDGSRFWASGLVMAMLDGDRVIGFLKIMRDMTERRTLEEELTRQAAQLREADRKKDDFLATLAHELRNPLMPISNALQILKRAKNNETLPENARQTMQRQLTHLVRLVDDLLDIGRISRGKLNLRLTQVELAETIQQAVESIRPLADSLGHTLQLSLPPEPVWLTADPVRLTQIIGNLLNNACKYSAPGGKIFVLAELHETHIVVKIRDSGFGIPSDQLQKIFEPFTQVHEALDESRSGLGIGLALVRHLVELHGGSIIAQSAGAGHGSEFVVRLPTGRQHVERNTQLDIEPEASHSGGGR